MMICCSPKDRGNGLSNPDTDVLPDSLFKYFDRKEITESALSVDFDSLSRIYKLTSLTVDQRRNYTDELFKDGRHYNAVLYSKQRRLKQIQPILIYAYADHYSSVLLLTLTNSGVVKGRLELTQEICDVIDQEGDRETVYCEKKHSTFKDDSTVLVCFVKETRIDSANQITSNIDSLASAYRILSSGSIQLVQRDSVRYLRR